MSRYKLETAYFPLVSAIGIEVNELLFEYVNHHGEQHTYRVKPEAVAEGPYREEGIDRSLPRDNFLWVMHAHVIERDGAPRNLAEDETNRRTFILSPDEECARVLTDKQQAFLQALNDLLVEEAMHISIPVVPIKVPPDGLFVLTGFNDQGVVQTLEDYPLRRKYGEWREIDIHLHIYPEPAIDSTAENVPTGQPAQLVKVRQIASSS